MIKKISQGAGVSARKQVAIMMMVPFLFLAACSSPEEQAQKYYEKGMQLLDEGKTDKAQLEFKNALQIKKNLTAAIYGMSLVAEKKGDWQPMFSLLNTVIEQDPKHLQAHIRLGKLFLAAGQVDKALEISNKALAINKDDLSALALHASVQLKMNDAKGAIETANRVLSKDPTYLDALVVLATERLLAGDAPKAIEYMDRAIKHDEKNIALNLMKIEALNSISQPDQAEKIYRKLIELYPDEVSIRHALVRFYFKNGRKDDAEAELRAAIKRTPNELQPKLDLVGFLNTVKGAAAARQELEGFVRNEPDNYGLSFALVNFYRVNKDAKAAESLLREIMKKAGNNPDGLKAKGLLASLTIERGDKKEAAQMLEEILAEDKRNEQALLLRAGMLTQNGKFDAAISDLRTVLRDAPDSAQALMMLAHAHELAGSPELADEHYLRAFQVGKMATPFGLAYSDFLMKRQQPERAEKILEEMLDATPGNLSALKMLARIKLMRGDEVGAQKVAEAIRRAGDKENVAEQIMGTIFASRGNYTESIAAFKRAYEAAPGQKQPAIALVRAYLQAGKTKEAMSFLASMLEANPDNIDARVMQGQVWQATGDKKQAIEAYSDIIKRAPKNPIGYQQLAGLYLRDAQVGEAEKIIDQGLAAIPQDQALRLAQAAMLEQATRYDEAIKVYEGLLAERPDSDVVLNNLASLLSERKDKASLDRAYALAQRFGKSDIPQFKDTYGWASYKVGKHNEAIAALESVVKQLPEVPVFRYHLGMSYLGKGDPASKKSARLELEKALKLAEKQPFAQADEIRKTLKTL